MGAIGIIVLVYGVNALGIRESSLVNIIFTLIEAGGLFFVIYVAFPYIGKVNYVDAPLMMPFNEMVSPKKMPVFFPNAFFAYSYSPPAFGNAALNSA